MKQRICAPSLEIQTVAAAPQMLLRCGATLPCEPTKASRGASRLASCPDLLCAPARPAMRNVSYGDGDGDGDEEGPRREELSATHSWRTARLRKSPDSVQPRNRKESKSHNQGGGGGDRLNRVPGVARTIRYVTTRSIHSQTHRRERIHSTRTVVFYTKT